MNKRIVDGAYPFNKELANETAFNRLNFVLLEQSVEPFKPLAAGGISDHSSDERYFITSIDNLSAENMKAFTSFLVANGIGYKAAMGRYEGETEFSWVINARDWDKVKFSGFINRQDAILYLYPISYGYSRYGRKARRAVLIDLWGNPDTELGTFQPVNESDLSESENWTYADETFWATRRHVEKGHTVYNFEEDKKPSRFNSVDWETFAKKEVA